MSEDQSRGARPGTSTGRATQVRDGGMARTGASALGSRDVDGEGRRSARSAPSAGAAAAAAQRSSSSRTASSTQARRRAAQAATSGQPRQRRAGPRKVRLTVRAVDPWSVMKVSFLVSVALGIAFVVAVAVLWGILSQMNVFTDVNALVQQVTSGEDTASPINLLEALSFGRVVSIAMVIGVLDVILLTALATLTAFLYNICAALVGGFQLTLSDE